MGRLNATTARRAIQIDFDRQLGLDGEQFENDAGKYRGPLHGAKLMNKGSECSWKVPYLMAFGLLSLPKPR